MPDFACFGAADPVIGALLGCLIVMVVILIVALVLTPRGRTGSSV